MAPYSDKFRHVNKYASTEGSHAHLIARDFAVSRARSVRRHNAEIIHRRLRWQIVKSSSGVGLGVVAVLAFLELLRALFG